MHRANRTSVEVGGELSGKGNPQAKNSVDWRGSAARDVAGNWSPWHHRYLLVLAVGNGRKTGATPGAGYLAVPGFVR